VLSWRYDGEQFWLSAALSPDGKLLAVQGEGNLVHLIDAATGKEIRGVEGPNKYPDRRPGSLRTQAEAVRFLTFSRDSRFMAGAARNSLCVWEVATGKLHHQIKSGRGQLAYSPDGKHLACGDEEALRLYEIASGKQVQLEQAEGWLQFPAFSPDGKTLAAQYGCAIRLWDMATGKRRAPYLGHDHPALCLAFSPDGTSLASGSGEVSGSCEVLVWDVATRKPRHAFTGDSFDAQSLAFSPDGKMLASCDRGRESSIYLWDLDHGRLKREFFAHISGVQSVVFSPEGKTLASAGWDDRLRLWDVASGQRLRQMRISDSQSRRVTFAPDGKTLLVAGRNNESSLWRTDSGQKVHDLGGAEDKYRSVLFAAFLPDGKTILSRDFSDGRRPFNGVRFWDAQSGRLLRSLPMSNRDPWWLRMALSPDGKTLATGGGLWDTDTGKRLTRLPEHPGGVAALAFSPDGKLLASGGWDSTVLLWDVGHARLEHLWTELAAADADSAQAVKKLAAKPEEAVPFLRDRLRRAADIEVRAGGLIADLDSDEFPVREKASAELEKLGPDVAFALRATLERDPSAEVRRRIQTLLDRMKRPGEESAGWDPRSVRLSLTVLEEIGTLSAQQILEELTKGPASSSVARQARTALERLAKRQNGR
jgi:WD40 repeat protein